MADGKEDFKMLKCAACSARSTALHGIEDLPFMPLCPAHVQMAYDDPETLLQEVKSRGRVKLEENKE